MKNLKHMFSLYYFSSVVEGALYNTYMALFLRNVKGIDASEITILMSAGFVVSLFVSPLFGILIDKLKRYNALFILSIVAYVCTLFCWFRASSMGLLYFSFILYTLAKMPILTLGDMFAAHSQKLGYIDFGKVRSFAAVGYAITPMILGFVFSVFFHNTINYELVMILMGIIVIMNAMLNIHIAKFIKFDKKEKGGIRCVKLTKYQFISLLFLMTSSVIFNGTNNFSVNLQSIYIEEIFYSTACIGIVVLVGSILEWPLMQISTRIHNRLGLFRSLYLLCALVIIRWILYYVAGVYQNLGLLLIGSSINGIGQALFLPLSIRYLRQIASNDNFGFLFTLNGSLNAAVNWLFYQAISKLTTFMDLTHVYLVFAGLGVVWLLVLCLWKSYKGDYASTLEV